MNPFRQRDRLAAKLRALDNKRYTAVARLENAKFALEIARRDLPKGQSKFHTAQRRVTDRERDLRAIEAEIRQVQAEHDAASAECDRFNYFSNRGGR